MNFGCTKYLVCYLLCFCHLYCVTSNESFCYPITIDRKASIRLYMTKSVMTGIFWWSILYCMDVSSIRAGITQYLIHIPHQCVLSMCCC